MFRYIDPWPVAYAAWRFLAVALIAGSGPFAAGLEVEAPAPQDESRTIAVLEFVDKGPSVELAVLRTALAEMLSGDLAQYEGLRVVERIRVDQFLREANLQGGFADTANVERAAGALAARYLVSGSFQGKDQTVTIEASLFEVGNQSPVAQWKESVPATALLDLEQDLVGKLLTALSVEEPRRRTVPDPKPGPSPNVAVLAFRNLSPSARLEAMESGFADLLQANLGALENVRLVERERIYEVLKEQELSLSGLVDAQTAVRVGRLVGAERLIYGSFVELGTNLRLDVRLADTKTASIVTAQIAAGRTEDFAVLLENLALRLAAHLAVKPPPDAAALVKAATPTRKIEAAIHFADGERAFYLGRFQDSADAYQRVLLIDPDSGQATWRRMQACYFERHYDEVIEAGRRMLDKGLVPKKVESQRDFFLQMRDASRYTHRYDEYIEVCRAVIAEFPKASFAKEFAKDLPVVMLFTKRRDEGIADLEQSVRDRKKDGDRQAYVEALWRLQTYYGNEAGMIKDLPEYRQRRLRDPEYAKEISALTKRGAERANELLGLLIKEAEGKRDRRWAGRAYAMFGKVNPTWLDETGRERGLLGAEEQEKLIVELLRVFSWVPRAALEGHERLAYLRVRQERWEEAIEPFQYVLEHTRVEPYGAVPDSWDLTLLQRTSQLDQKIGMMARIGSIYHVRLKKSREAADEYNRLVEEFGVAHHKGVDAAMALHELGEDLPRPERAALVWGGGDEAHRVWTNALEPIGLKVHRVAQYEISAGHLAPYELVILVRTGNIPYTPADMLALRSYVATGGSLLVIVSSGWEHAQPGIHDPLLALFGMGAVGETAVRAHSTHIAEHPITKGVEKAMAKNAVHLKVGVGTALIQAGDRTLLAVRNYRHGRLAVASFGQWFLPDPEFPVSEFLGRVDHWTRQIPREKLSLEAGQRVHLPLLRNVLAWLIHPYHDPEVREKQELFTEARLVGLKVQLGTASARELTRAMEKLIAEVEPGTWKEEALWTAGESSLLLVYYPGRGSGNPKLGWGQHGDPPVPAPHYYQRLVDEFPDTALRPYAQWRLAECERCKPLHEARTRYPVAPNWASVIPAYQKVEAPTGSYVWAWTRLRLGAIHFRAGDFAKALEHFQPVADTLGHSPEKSMALINAATCHLAMKDKQEAGRYFRIALSEPDVYWAGSFLPPYSDWAPLKLDGHICISPTKKISERYLNALGLSVR